MGDEMERWNKLDVWRLADELAQQVYQVTRRFPREELYGITSQLRRTVVSVATNIVEGYSRRGDRELVRFLEISLGSSGESKYLLHLSHRLGYMTAEEYARLSNQADRVGQTLYRFYERVKKGRTSKG